MGVSQLSWLLAAALLGITAAVALTGIRRSRRINRVYQWPPPGPAYPRHTQPGQDGEPDTTPADD